jgi:plastocyanin
MNKYLIALGAVIVIVAVIIAGYFVYNNITQQKIALQNTATQKIAKPTIEVAQPIPAKTITLTSAGFNPAVLNIKTGDRVVWRNNSGTVGAVNSDTYPTNLLHPFLNFGQFKNGSSFSTIFSKPGIYTYYNFENQTQKGTVVVR